MNSLADALERVEKRRKHLEICTADAAVATELQRQFATRNVDVEHTPVAGFDEPGFAIVRGADGGFAGALGLDQFGAVLSPERHPPWELGTTDVDTSSLFDFLEQTLFASYDRRQMIAATREIEERAWRLGDGTLYVGFQRESALLEQADVYERFDDRDDLAVAVFIADEWSGQIGDISVVESQAAEIGQFWFVLFDGAENRDQSCGLLAAERRPGEYYGFWTYDSEFVSELIAYLESTYDPNP
ncbi:histidine kinase [Salinadaptatus halalkaliphilus]|uniref:Histidine kinase n=1 Tax=Salinadaptatus halalkaliphilus TaxID=2419781 RepID=A0A4V3VLG1_9EURY|nr:DICT sensory domain-containing protein [Salinadaptatus halalkaliphilus]THE65507.1 histidine kinase [Salinadaptatus halalkaliphilus]